MHKKEARRQVVTWRRAPISITSSSVDPVQGGQRNVAIKLLPRSWRSWQWMLRQKKANKPNKIVATTPRLPNSTPYCVPTLPARKNLYNLNRSQKRRTESPNGSKNNLKLRGILKSLLCVSRLDSYFLQKNDVIIPYLLWVFKRTKLISTNFHQFKLFLPTLRMLPRIPRYQRPHTIFQECSGFQPKTRVIFSFDATALFTSPFRRSDSFTSNVLPVTSCTLFTISKPNIPCLFLS